MDVIAELAYVTTVGGIAAGYASVFRYLLEYLCAGVSASFGTTAGGGTCCMGLVANAFPWSAGTPNVVSCAHAAAVSGYNGAQLFDTSYFWFVGYRLGGDSSRRIQYFSRVYYVPRI